MANVKIAAFDVDCVVVDLSVDWWKYLENLSSPADRKPFEEVSRSYDFSKHYPNISKKEAFEFWKAGDLYDDKTPVQGTVRALQRFHDAGIHILFVSHIEGNHGKSKFEFLKRYFPFMKGYIPTREKGYVQPCIAFDDRLKHLQHYKSIKSDVTTVRVLTPHDQNDHHGGNPSDFIINSSLWTNDDIIDTLIESVL